MTALPAQQLIDVDVHVHRAAIDQVLQRVSELVRADVQRSTRSRRNFRRADLVSRRFRDADLRGSDFRGALLLGADLRGADLRCADLIGTDLRGAALHGADLSSSLFLTQFQVNAAGGDPATALPALLIRPCALVRDVVGCGLQLADRRRPNPSGPSAWQDAPVGDTSANARIKSATSATCVPFRPI